MKKEQYPESISSIESFLRDDIQKIERGIQDGEISGIPVVLLTDIEGNTQGNTVVVGREYVLYAGVDTLQIPANTIQDLHISMMILLRVPETIQLSGEHIHGVQFTPEQGHRYGVSFPFIAVQEGLTTLVIDYYTNQRYTHQEEITFTVSK